MTKLLSKFTVGDTVVRFDAPAEGKGAPQLSLHPKSLAPGKHREFLPPDVEIVGLPAKWQPRRAWALDSLVQLKCMEDIYGGSFSQGRTMRSGHSTAVLEFIGQKVQKMNGGTSVVTTLQHPSGLRCEHQLSWQGNVPVFSSRVSVRNAGKKPVPLEMLSSFSLGGMTPYAHDDAPNRLLVHRYRSTWSAEGRLDTQGIEDLQLERSWIGHGISSERFGQVGSMPVRGFFPFVALEDREAGVLWGAQLACPGSWQMEVFRKDDFVALSGGQADREFGHWFKTLKAGETYDTPVATIGCIKGDIDQLAQRLSSAQERSLTKLSKIENELPIVVNEWCTSWGNPTQENLLALAKRLHGTPAKYLVIDDGWAERPGGGIQQNGDWIINRTAFPDGLAATCQALRDHGLIPGIWFEFEVCNPGSKAFDLTDHHLQRDGRVLQVGGRRYWDFRDPFTSDYLTQKLIHLLRDNGFGYLKVDYNETIGFGVDGAESPGEGLRQHLEGVQKFFRKLREEIPDLVIENCSSGGHRLEPSMMGLCAMGSFSDAHETREIPIIAANLHRLILPRQSQVWAVLRKNDSAQRLAYSLAATLLGRMCLSGEVHDLSPAQWKLTVSAMELYRRVYPIIRDGHSTFHGETGKSWRHPKGWQAVLRTAKNGKRALLVAHTFGRSFPKSVEIPLPDAGWEVEETWPKKHGIPANLKGKSVQLDLTGEFRATVISLRKRPNMPPPIH
ncbi:MAG: alpha-galactosidase [Opitutus sp.]|nr:alpha-galactosidase [Opitutus sp.]MCS6246275.1 alpha-galactosidase [Opitutus sp.]MCS6273851.1 alpha-galactosidase [Opitutus sp.]MCS6277562.1 alpha-galactosidase [Opitutus sp.]MCS6300680.1 alpha-galactosidase [Opitutus sp.]